MLPWISPRHTAIAALAAASLAAPALAQSAGSSFFGTRWNLPAPSNAVLCPPRGGAYGPGAANWSIMNPGIGIRPGADADHPAGDLTTLFDNLLPPPDFTVNPPTNVTRPAQLFQMALQTWQNGAANAITFVNNPVLDGGGLAGATAQNGGNSGDMRVGVYQFLAPQPTSLAAMDILAHGFYPNSDTANLLNDGLGSIGGDIHFRPNSLYNPQNGVQWWGIEGNAPGGSFDLLTVMIHEIGHAIGLEHNNGDNMSVMNPMYTGVRRQLSGTDIQNVVTVYTTPAPGAAGLLGAAGLFAARRRRPR